MFTFSQFSFASICLVSMLALTIRTASASPMSQTGNDFSAVTGHHKAGQEGKLVVESSKQ